MTATKYQPLTLEGTYILEDGAPIAQVFVPERYGSRLAAAPVLYNACDGALAFLDKQIAEMKRLTQPWERREIENMIDEYSQVAVAMKLALEIADGRNA